MTRKLFCFGLGYCATHLIEQLRRQPDDNWTFAGTRRRLTEAPTGDVAHYLFDGDRPLEDAGGRLADVTHMLISIPPREAHGDPVLYHHARDIARLKNLKWIGYLSTTGIYGDRKGDWVDDDSAPAPTSARGRLRLEAEQDWLGLFRDHGLPVHIFRLGSIYGPGRGQLEGLLNGKLRKIVKEGQYFSRIHIADIVQVLIASWRAPHPGRSYNVVDDLPTSAQEIIDYLCDLLERPRLPALDIENVDASPLMKSFYSESKRVRNQRIKQELGVALTYPTYREGFSNLLRNLP